MMFLIAYFANFTPEQEIYMEFIPLEDAYEKYGRAEGEAYPLE
jgi:hypothetical protein